MSNLSTKIIERNSRFSLALAKNKAEQSYLSVELEHLEKEKRTSMRMLNKDKKLFTRKYCTVNVFGDTEGNEVQFLERQNSLLLSTKGYEFGRKEDDTAKREFVDIEQMHELLFTNDEVDKEKVLCLHLVSAHRAETFAPSRRTYPCKIHSPVEKLLQRSKRNNLSQNPKFSNFLPIYTIELKDFGANLDKTELINDGRLATRLLINETIRLLIDTVLTALKQSNPEKSDEIVAMANDVDYLKEIFTKQKILHLLDRLKTCSFINSCDSFVLTAPFRVKPVQIDIRTPSGNLELLLTQIRQNLLQTPTRANANSETELKEPKNGVLNLKSPIIKIFRKNMQSTAGASKTIEEVLHSERSPKLSHDLRKKTGRHVDTNFIRKNIEKAAMTRKFAYDSDNDSVNQKRRLSKNSNKSTRSSGQESIIESAKLEPVNVPDGNLILPNEEKPRKQDEKENQVLSKRNNRKFSTDSDTIRIHLKQTTCPACMEKYKIPLPAPKTPRVKPSSVIPLAADENPELKTNRKNRISLLINKEMFKLESYERRFSADENSKRGSVRGKELETVSSNYLYFSSLELAKIQQEVREKETQKKLEKFLRE